MTKLQTRATRNEPKSPTIAPTSDVLKLAPHNVSSPTWTLGHLTTHGVAIHFSHRYPSKADNPMSPDDE